MFYKKKTLTVRDNYSRLLFLYLPVTTFKMADPLKNIETLFSEGHWLKAEELFDSEKVKYEVAQPKKNDFLFTFEKTKTAIKVKSSSVIHSCSCADYRVIKECPHVLVGLLYIRKLRSELKKPVKAPRSRDSFTSKLNLKSILSQASPEEINQFLRSYSVKDKSFALALKVHFARKIELDNNNDKYVEIFKSVVKPKTHKYNKLTLNHKRDLHRTLDDLLDNLKDAMSMEQFREAMYIITNAFENIFYVRKNYQNRNERLAEQESGYIQVFSQLLEQKLPPVLLTELKGKIIDICMLSYFTPLPNNFVAPFIKHKLLTPAKAKDIINLLIPKMNVYEEFVNEYILVCLLLCELDLSFSDLIPDSIKISSVNDKIIKMDFEEFPNLPLRIAKYRIDQGKSDKRLEQFYIKGLIVAEDKNIFSQIKTFYQTHKDLNLTIRIIQNLDEDFLKKNLKKINSIFVEEEIGIRLEVFKATDQVDLLFDELLADGELHHLWEHDEIIEPLGEDKLKYIYDELLIKHLTVYAGTKGNDAVNTTIQKLTALGYKKIAKGLQTKVRDKFSHRKFLLQNIL